MEKKREKIEEIDKCPECGSDDIETDRSRAETVCQDCGLVIDDNLIDPGPDWRAFDREQEEKRAHTGPPATLMRHDRGLATIIDQRNQDSYGRPIPARNVPQLYRIRKWQRRIRIGGARERSLAIALSELDRMASGMELPRVVRETAAMIYRKVALKNLARGRTIEGVIAAVLYAACRQCNVPRTLDEVAFSSNGVSRREIGRTYRFLRQELGLKLVSTSPIDYVSRFCSQLKLNGGVRNKVIEILKEAAKKKLSVGKSPSGTAAASIYIASVLCGKRRTQEEVADVAGVTEVTVRNRYKELAEKLDIDIVL